MATLKDVAPARAANLPLRPSDTVWQLNLDQVESVSGRILNKVTRPFAECGSSTQSFDTGNVLYSKLRPYLNKVVCPDDSGVATTELVPLRPDPARLDRGYLTHYLRSPRFVTWVSKEVAGAKMPRVSMKVFWEHEIPFPSLDEQKRIAAILDAADELRTKRRESLAQLDTLLQSTFLELFGDPVTNPKGWKRQTVGEFAKVKGGKRLPKGEDYADAPTGYRYIRVSDISPNRIDESDLRNLKPETQKKIARYIVESGDIIITIAGTIGLTTAVPDSLDGVNLTENAAKIVPEDKRRVNATYLSYALQMPHAQSQIRSHTGQVTIGKLALFRIEKIEVLLPPEDQQKRFADFVTETESQRRRMTEQLDDLDTLFASLQSRAFLGAL